ncbi:hypothetical protein [Breoghania sp.]|uniref:hypothetical protein n=1 Tax=Breoghania sp. TaxID=2065378 RepID=UPI00260AF5E3|nr:hypothetical protein [Breoghania sp.]MDJ0931780.1 hypothetical protein [Breoghania sp.]
MLRLPEQTDVQAGVREAQETIDKFNMAVTLSGACWRVLMLDKEMLLFPLMSLVALGLVMAGIFVPAFAGGDLAQF